MSQFISIMIPDPDNHVRRDGKLESSASFDIHLTLYSIHHAKRHRKAIGYGPES